MIVYTIIWAETAAPQGAKIATGCGELAIVITKKAWKEHTNKRQPRKANPIERSLHYQE